MNFIIQNFYCKRKKHKNITCIMYNIPIYNENYK